MLQKYSLIDDAIAFLPLIVCPSKVSIRFFDNNLVDGFPSFIEINYEHNVCCQVLGSGTEKIWDLVTYILLFALVLLILAIKHVR